MSPPHEIRPPNLTRAGQISKKSGHVGRTTVEKRLYKIIAQQLKIAMASMAIVNKNA